MACAYVPCRRLERLSLVGYSAPSLRDSVRPTPTRAEARGAWPRKANPRWRSNRQRPDPRLVSEGAISDEALRKAEEFIEQEEGAANRLTGWAGLIVTAIAIAMTLFHLYAAFDIVPTQPLRYTHVAFVLVLCYPAVSGLDALSQFASAGGM